MVLAFWNMNSHWPVSYEKMYSNDEHKWFKWWTWEMLIETRELKVEVRLTLGLKDIKCIINCYDYLLDWVHMLDALLFIDWIHLIHSSIDILLSSPHETFVSLWAFASQSLCLTFTPIIPSHFHWQSWMGTCQVHHILLSSRDSVSVNSNEMKFKKISFILYLLFFPFSLISFFPLEQLEFGLRHNGMMLWYIKWQIFLLWWWRLYSVILNLVELKLIMMMWDDYDDREFWWWWIKLQNVKVY